MDGIEPLGAYRASYPSSPPEVRREYRSDDGDEHCKRLFVELDAGELRHKMQ